MRTTLTIDDDVLAAAREFARTKGMSLGAAISELARRGFDYPPAIPDPSKPGVFRVDPNARPIISEDIYRALDNWP